MEHDVRVAGGTADIETGQLLVIQLGEVLMEHDVRLAGGTADFETGHLLIQKRSLCPIEFCKYKNDLMSELFTIVVHICIVLS